MSTQKRRALLTLAHRLMSERAVLPEGKSGNAEVRHNKYEPGAELMLVPMRTAFHTGLPQMEYVCQERTIVQSLLEDGSVWMTDLPCELVQMHDELARRVRGRVLVGGLGLGVLPRMLLNNPAVTSITVVERSADVVALVAPTLDCERLSVVTQDIHELGVERREYDFALLDTWAHTGEMTWTSEVVPLRRKFVPLVRGVRCWHESVMLSQVARGIFHAATVLEKDYAHLPVHYHAFVRGLDQLRVERKRSDDMAERLALSYEIAEFNRDVRAVASVFLHQVGNRRWEHWFGGHWDQHEEAGS